MRSFSFTLIRCLGYVSICLAAHFWVNLFLIVPRERPDLSSDVRPVLSFGARPEDTLNDETQTNQMSSFQGELKGRLKHLHSACSDPRHEKYLLQEYSKFLNVEQNWTAIVAKIPYRPEFLVHRERKLGWCKVPKASSASMVESLLFEFGASRIPQKGIWGHTKLIKLMPPLLEGENYEDIKAFIIVRHPFSRLLSAFRDKFHNRTITIQFKKFRRLYGMKIIRKYRKKKMVNERYRDVPTFREFLEYVVDTPSYEYNEHWIPYYLSCAPCHIKYKAILHTESIAEDIIHLIDATGLNIQLKKHHKTPIRIYEKKEIETFVGKERLLEGKPITNDLASLVERFYYSTVSKNLLEKVYNIYWFDFLLFNYSVHPYDYYVR